MPGSNRGTATYSITGDAGSSSVQVDQTAGATSGQLKVLSWAHHFAPGATARVKLTPPVGQTASADSVQLTEYSKQTREPDQRDAWHSFAVGSLVQKWVDGGTNNGFLLKGTDDSTTGPNGGVFYNASEDVYGGETAYRPNLVVTYGEPGVALNPPAAVHASGPELSWSKYVDPTPDEEDNLVEYQIFRGCKALPGGDCASPVGDHFVPGDSRFELVGTVASDVRRWTDESATPSTPTADAVYGYWVVARTVDDTHNGRDGRASSNAQVVKIPREGRIVRAFTGDIADTTLSSSQSTTVLGKPDGHDWLQVGNGHSTYGQERAVLKFDLADADSGIKPGLKVTDARLELSESTGVGSGTPTFDLHALTKPFVEAEASWAKANATTNWASPGGDHESAVLGSVTATNTPKRLTFTSTALAGKVQSWVADSSVNHGFLLKAGSTASQYLNIVSSESSDTLFRPRLVVEHLAKDDAQTYEANEIPQRWVPGTTITTPVRVTNTSNQTWPSNLQLSYRWTLPDSSEDITTSGDRNFVALGKALAPGESVRLDLPIRTPINSDTRAKRQAYDLYLDLWGGDSWFSATNPPSSNTTEPTQGCAVVTKGLLCVDRYVEDPRSNQLGLEKFLSYTGEETGAGAQLLTNLYSGNAVWSYDAMSNPSIGPSAFVRLAYNSMDVSDSGAGYGVSVQPATLTRLGSRLSVPSGGSAANVMTFIDGDGTTHSYKIDEDTAAKTTYVRPPGIPLELARDKTAVTDKQWVFTRPDGTRFFFSQATGLQTEVRDSSGRALTFRYDTSDRLTSVVDSSSRTVLTLGYDAAGLAWIRDISGRALKFTYNSTHQLVKLEDGGGFDTSTQTFADPTKVKAFTLGYTDTSVNGNAKLNLVKDPRGASTTVEYFPSTEASFYKNWPKQYTDRRGNATTFAYSDPDSSAAWNGLATTGPIACSSVPISHPRRTRSSATPTAPKPKPAAATKDSSPRCRCPSAKASATS